MKKSFLKSLPIFLAAVSIASIAVAAPPEKAPLAPSTRFQAIVEADQHQVFHAKKMLTALGYYTGPINHKEDFKFTQSVKYFQKDNDLATTGTLNQRTSEALKQEYKRLFKKDPVLPEQKNVELKSIENRQPERRVDAVPPVENLEPLDQDIDTTVAKLINETK